MSTWSDRPREEAFLLNPAFCGLLSFAAIDGYMGDARSGMPFFLSFLMLPVVLHKKTREALPRSTRTSVAAWLEEHAEARIGFAERTRALVPFTREGLLFASKSGVVAINAAGELVRGSQKPATQAFVKDATDESRDCVKKANLIGRWFATAGSAQTVMALWGVRP